MPRSTPEAPVLGAQQARAEANRLIKDFRSSDAEKVSAAAARLGSHPALSRLASGLGTFPDAAVVALVKRKHALDVVAVEHGFRSWRDLILRSPDGAPVPSAELSQVGANSFVRGPAVAAEAHTDDFVVQASFDAAPWLSQASDVEIVQLARIGWGGDYEADHVARFMEDLNAEVAQLFVYLSFSPRSFGEPVGFECHLDPEAARAWVAENRPHLKRADTGGDGSQLVMP